MKTAMELALARIELMKDINANSIHWEMFKNDCMEKEKEQIIDAHKIGWEDCQEYIKTIGQTTRKGKRYYNQTYNQNK
jgi:hypothetical protein